MGLSPGTKGMLPIKPKKASIKLESQLQCVSTNTAWPGQPIALIWCFRTQKANQWRQLCWNPMSLKVRFETSAYEICYHWDVVIFSCTDNMIWCFACRNGGRGQSPWERQNHLLHRHDWICSTHGEGTQRGLQGQRETYCTQITLFR